MGSLPPVRLAEPPAPVSVGHQPERGPGL